MYNSKIEAIRKLRSKKMSDYDTQSEIEAGTDDLNDELRDQTAKETDLAPSLKDMTRVNEGQEVDEDDYDMVPPPNQPLQQKMQKQGLDQGDAILPSGMYEDGDEKKKGFMGKAAMLMKKKLGR